MLLLSEPLCEVDSSDVKLMKQCISLSHETKFETIGGSEIGLHITTSRYDCLPDCLNTSWQRLYQSFLKVISTSPNEIF